MRILIAMDSYKGTMSSKALGDIITDELSAMLPGATINNVPIADGGEGTIEALGNMDAMTTHHVKVHGPLMQPIDAAYLMHRNTAILEMASVAGLGVIPESRRNPLKTTTYGLGEMILYAIGQGANDIIIGLGGSATNDAGTGMLHAMGYRFKNQYGDSLEPIGGNLEHIHTVDASQAMTIGNRVHFLLASDVNNPFYGPNGAAHIYGPQKGATPKMVATLDQGMRHYASLIKDQYKTDLQAIKGAGAAGGLPAGFLPFFNTTLKAGIDLIFEKIHLEDRIQEADLVITGEGRVDEQTLMNKAPYGVVKLAHKHGKPCIILAGTITEKGKRLSKHGASLLKSIHEPFESQAGLNLSKEHTESRIRQTLRSLETFIREAIE